MADVARLAGVSHQTVSRVLNDSPAVRGETRDRVLAAVASLDYRRNTAARALASARSGVIGVVALETTLYGPATSLYAVERAARTAGYYVSVVVVDTDRPDALDEALDRLVTQGVEGAIVIAPLPLGLTALPAAARGLPVVVTQGFPGEGWATVGVDQRRGAELATLHLLDAGAGSVWHVAGPDEWPEARGRVEGWRAALAARGIEPPDPLHGDWSPASGYEIGQRLADRADLEAVFVANDHMALGLLRALREKGVRVPEDVLVVGFDDIPEAAYVTPPLSTVRQDFLAMGGDAMALLLDELSGVDHRGTQLLIEAELVVRESSTPR